MKTKIISSETKAKIVSIVNVFETGKVEGSYHTLVKLPDGPKGIKQITYGRSQTTEFGNLKRLLQMYVERKGLFADEIKKYLPKVGKSSLVLDLQFCKLLKDAGNSDEIMKLCQDEFFDLYYFDPAFIWYEGYGFKEPLSLLVIYDSFIHSGGIKNFLRQRFPERPPKYGGNEQNWISQYVNTRHEWLKNHPRKILQKTIYRTNLFKFLVVKANWNLNGLITVKGINIL